MGFEKEKRKNDERRGFLPVWVWTLIIGFILGVIVMGLARPASPGAVVTVSGDSLTVNEEAIYATATYIIEQATATQAAIDAAKP